MNRGTFDTINDVPTLPTDPKWLLGAPQIGDYIIVLVFTNTLGDSGTAKFVIDIVGGSIVFNGTQNINTTILASGDITIYSVFNRISGSLYGGRNGFQINARNAVMGNTNTRFDYGTGTTLTVVHPNIDIKLSVTDSPTLTEINNIVDARTPTTFSSTTPIYLGGVRDPGTISSLYSGKVYEFKISGVSGNLLVDYAPIKAGTVVNGNTAPSDCFYDSVSNTFKTSVGLLFVDEPLFVQPNFDFWITKSGGSSPAFMDLSWLNAEANVDEEIRRRKRLKLI
jgi:hypothetical protein